MRCDGPELFADGALRPALLERLDALVREEVIGVLIEYGEVPLRELRRVAVQLARLEVRPIILGKPLLASRTPARSEGCAPVGLSCEIPFTGDTDLFRRSVTLWPPARRVRGRVRGSKLTFAAEGWVGDEPWLAAVIGSELAEVERVLAFQERFLRRFARERDVEIRRLVDHVYPNIDVADLKRKSKAAIAIAGPDDLYLAQSEAAWKQAMKDLWLSWKSVEDIVTLSF